MPRVEHHDSFVRKDKECGVVMVVRLEAGTDEYFFAFIPDEVVLHGFDVSMYVDVSYVSGVDAAVSVFIVQSPWVGKPTPI